ncbi:MAG TPA: NAD-dependent epimerase/dehydratase family protein [Gaiellaceae bacterium]|nr:NAD-dependent epimerase/dehydratase family protein [Gaiellaceae bacterium]
MRVFVVGATGAIGQPLVRLLVERGDTVAGMTRSQPDVVRALGAEPVVCDVYDAAAVREAIESFASDAVINELTDLPDRFEDIDAERQERIRTEGNANVIAALGGAKYVVQSVAFPLEGDAINELERASLAVGGVVLRYGYSYGPGTYSDGSEELPPEPRVHVETAARRTVEAIDLPSGVLEVTD